MNYCTKSVLQGAKIAKNRSSSEQPLIRPVYLYRKRLFENTLNKFKLGIVAKGLIIVAIPLVFECAVVAAMGSLEAQAEVAAAKAERAREISTLINELIHELYTGLQSVRLNAQSFSAGYNRIERIQTAKTKIRRLKELFTGADSKDIATLDSVELAIDEGNDMVRRAEQAFIAGDTDEIKKLHLQSLHFAERVITPELIALGERQKAIYNQDPSVQESFRHQMRTLLMLALIASTLGTLLMALVTTRSVTRRLAQLADNSRRIAGGETLPSPMPGNDEISSLDCTLHKMAQNIDDLLLRERVILENARDIICVISKNLQVERISPSVMEVLEYHPAEVVGQSCLALIEKDSPQATEIARFVSGHDAKDQIETTVKTKSGRGIDMLLSLSYVNRQENCILIFHDITELKKAERFKQDVVNMVSHDLRSPLTMVSHILEMLQEGVFGNINEDGLNMLDRAEQSTQHMSRLVSDLLDLERIQNGSLRLDKTKVPGQSLLERAAELTAVQALAAHCQVEMGPCEGLVHCDPLRINQVLVNLITNALKFSPPGKNVVISSIVQAPYVVFSVRDQGRGIAPEMQDKIFEPFSQVRSQDSKSGIGLGLPICKALIEMHEGTIAVQSDKTGSVFSFTLPEIRS